MILELLWKVLEGDGVRIGYMLVEESGIGKRSRNMGLLMIIQLRRIREVSLVERVLKVKRLL